MKVYGEPVTLPTERVSEDYEVQHNEKIMIKRRDYGTLHYFPLWRPEEIEEKVLQQLISEFEDEPEATLLYAKVDVIAYIPRPNNQCIDIEVHIQSNHPFAVSTALAIVILCMGIAFSVWLGVMSWGTYRFIEETGGLGGGVAMVLMFIVIIVFALLVLGGSLAIGGKRGLKVGK